ncbi:hypothetical protein H696_05344 [Fonticula alba]|uniref:Uncharacterized protein n=1 Tax=Fonticula alba TaxID=691883 RepID=A0A058Z3J9_FONAL|nr:hypothetical protein H696_05344 [Fonticula alba]KCV68092.1 hypothetical protein H696_05344 [Fonticula alba]|eukprot:XP_009497466.1 hypothetical protein H696_05344 [Fonticula alba]
MFARLFRPAAPAASRRFNQPSPPVERFIANVGGRPTTVLRLLADVGPRSPVTAAPSGAPVSGPAAHATIEEVVGGPATSGPASTFESEVPVLVVIPGNPGVIEYYADFMRAVFFRMNGRIDVFGVEHFGHSPTTADFLPLAQSCRASRGSNPTGGNILQAQIEHHMCFLSELRRCRNPWTPLYLAGHSVGAHIALELTMADFSVGPDPSEPPPPYWSPSKNPASFEPGAPPARAPLSITHAFLMTPTLRKIGSTQNGQNLSAAFNPEVIAVLAKVVTVASMMPAFMTRRLLSAMASLSTRMAEVTADNFSGRVVNNCLHMAADEMDFLQELSPKKVLFLHQHGSRLVTCFYSPGDEWCTPGDAARLAYLVGLDNVFVVDPSVKHAFVTNVENTAFMANRVAVRLHDNLMNPRPYFQQSMVDDRSGLPSHWDDDFDWSDADVANNTPPHVRQVQSADKGFWLGQTDVVLVEGILPPARAAGQPAAAAAAAAATAPATPSGPLHDAGLSASPTRADPGDLPQYPFPVQDDDEDFSDARS